jgi:polyhydroxybutyrate depolymerase
MRRVMKVALGIALAAVVLTMPATAAAGPQKQQGTIVHWTIDGVQRDALVFGPAPATVAVKHPLVVAFHGHGGHMQGTSQLMHIQTLWSQAVVVYPQGLNTKTIIDPSGTKPGWQSKAGDDGDRDLKLFDAMVATMKQTYTVNTRRIYTTGFSNGGVFSYLLWAERPKAIAAVGEVAGRLDSAETLTTPRALLAVAGQQDTTDPFALQQQTIQQARQADAATGAGSSCGSYCTFYASSSGPTPVKTYIHPGGHVYPSWAPGRIVAFFKSHLQP